jgi:kynurenine formamidase
MSIQHRAIVDATVSFSNGGSIVVEGFRLDLASAVADDGEISRLLVSALGLLMADVVVVTSSTVIEEAHKGTRGGPSDRTDAPPAPRTRLVELNQIIRSGEVTYPGLPVPEITPHLTRAASRGIYAPGTEFAIDRISMVGNTGTYLDTAFHRYADGGDLADLALERVVDLPAVVVRTVDSGRRGVDAAQLAALDVTGAAVLLHTGGDTRWGRPEYALDAPFLTEAGAALLVERGAALVGIDSVNIDDVSPDAAGARPAHSILLAAGIPIVEHLTNLAEVPPTGAAFSAVPPRVAGFATFPVRAYARVPA